jgi:hypothetical protein
LRFAVHLERADYLTVEGFGGGDGACEHAVGRVRPAARERSGKHGVLGASGEERGYVVRVRARLGSREEARPDPDRRRSGGERGGHRAGTGDPSGGDHRHGNSVQHTGQQRQQRDGSAHMAPRLGSLHDDEVAACIGGAPRLLERADLPAGERAASMHPLDQPRVGLRPEELHEARACGSELHFLRITLPQRGDEVDTERTGLRTLDVGDPLDQRPRAGTLKHPQPARTTDRAHQRRGRYPTPHRGELDRDAAADELREGRLNHC